MSTNPYENVRNIINKCSGLSNTELINQSYKKKLLNTKNYYQGDNIDCIELQTLYQSILNKPLVNDSYNFTHNYWV